MDEDNLDISPTKDTVARFPEIKCLVENPTLNALFKVREDSAVRAKHRYHRLGRLAILLIALGSIYTIAEALHPPFLSTHSFAGVAATVIVGVGIFIQIYILATHQKRKWLLNRFAAERLRAIKFQGFLLAEAATDSADLEVKVEKFYRDEVDKLAHELNAGESILDDFAPAKILKATTASLSRPSKPVNLQVALSARRAYTELRVTYQLQFASSELKNLRNRRRIGDSSADLLYLGAAACVLIALVAKLKLPPGEEVSIWFDFLAVLTFIVGMSKAVLDNASLHNESESRFERYVNEIEAAEAACRDQDSALFDAIPQMELAALGELDAFCRAASKITYRL